MVEVFVLGATGRTGRGVAHALAAAGTVPVLVGRDAARLTAAAPADHEHRTLVATDLAAMVAAITGGRPGVVINTVGPFTRTAPALVDACLEAGSAYVDVANDMAAVPALLKRHGDAERAGVALVTGAGFGVTATESVVTWLCTSGRPVRHVRVDMVPSLELQAGPLGEALAGTITEGLPGVPGGGRYQGRRISDGDLGPAPIGGAPRDLVTPEGDRVRTALMPLGELVAAQRASRAPFVDAASSEVPSGRLIRAVLPLATGLLTIAPLRRFATRRLAGVTFSARPAPRAHSWGHAVVTWQDGTTTEGWLRLPEAQETTIAVAAEVAGRLARGEGRPGAFTPAALFGTTLATSIGGTYLEGRSPTPP